MKFIYLIFFLLILSCSTVKKVYVCGDHPCKSKKEFDNYFSKNLIYEIKSNTKSKNQNIDLVIANMQSNDGKIKNRINYKKNKRLNKKKQAKVKKAKVLKKKKIEKITKKNKISKNAIENQISNNREPDAKLVARTPLAKKNDILTKKTTENTLINSVKTKNIKSICDQFENCDIDKIAELLIKKGRDKPFPNITSK